MARKLKTFFKKIFIVYHINETFGRYGKTISIIFVPVAMAILLLIEHKLLGSIDPIKRLQRFALGYDATPNESLIIYLHFYLVANLVYAIRINPDADTFKKNEGPAKPVESPTERNVIKKSTAVLEAKERINKSTGSNGNAISIDKPQVRQETVQATAGKVEKVPEEKNRPVREEGQKELEEALKSSLWASPKENKASATMDKASIKESVLSKMKKKL